jgi:hypothetical protein
MEAAAVSRLISLVPERTTRSLTGTLFVNAGSDRAELLSRYLNWMSPLNALTKEEQQLFGLRAGATKPALEGEEEHEAAEELDESPISEAQPGTPIAA